MFITEKGILMRTRVADISSIGRNTQGVRLIKLDEGDKLVTLAKVELDEEDEKNGAGATPPPAEGSAPTDQSSPDEPPSDQPPPATEGNGQAPDA
jgi:DNA gyrase subunit A